MSLSRASSSTTASPRRFAPTLSRFAERVDGILVDEASLGSRSLSLDVSSDDSAQFSQNIRQFLPDVVIRETDNRISLPTKNF